MATKTKSKAYKPNVILWAYFYCLVVAIAIFSICIIIKFAGGILLGYFVIFLILWFFIPEMKKEIK
jgi:antibiotic biosynthesis monooxygenase (ABM) superfamily enzyme